MILVTGATGHLGTAVVQTLLQNTAADQIVALVRDENKASDFRAQGVRICVGDYDDTTSLDAAMQGVERVLLIASTNEENRLKQHQNVIEAAKKAGVQCLAYTSRNLKDRGTLTNTLMESHFQTEDAIKESGLSYALFRNVLYMDTIPQFASEKAIETGIHLPTGEGKVAFALRSEMGEAIANWLLKGECDNRTYQLTGSRADSFGDVAAALTRLSEQEVKYTPLEKSTFEAGLKKRGLPAAVITKIVGFLTDIKNGQESEVSPDLETLLGRKPASLREGLKILFAL